jgi:hypothetical protein
VVSLERVGYSLGVLIAAPIAVCWCVFKAIKQGPERKPGDAQISGALTEVKSTAIVARLADGKLRVIEDPFSCCE